MTIMPDSDTADEDSPPHGESADVLDMVERLLQHAKDERRRVDSVENTAEEALSLGMRNSERLDMLEYQVAPNPLDDGQVVTQYR